MRALITALVFLASAAQAQTVPTWTVSTEIHTYDPAVFAWQLHTALGTGVLPPGPGVGTGPEGEPVQAIPEGQWGYIYLPDLGLPHDLKSVTLNGQMLLSHGSRSNGHCDLELWMNDDERHHYGQVVEWHANGSPRQNYGVVVPVHNGMISLRWTVPPTAAFPTQYPGDPFSGRCNLGVMLYITQATR